MINLTKIYKFTIYLLLLMLVAVQALAINHSTEHNNYPHNKHQHLPQSDCSLCDFYQHNNLFINIATGNHFIVVFLSAFVLFFCFINYKQQYCNRYKTGPPQLITAFSI